MGSGGGGLQGRRLVCGWLEDERLVGRGGPEESGELAGDRDGRDGGALPAFGGEVAVAAVQPDLGLPGALVGERAAFADAGWVVVGPGGLDEQSARVVVAGLGDVPAVALLSGGVLRRDDPQPGAQLPRVTEPVKVADLGDQPERGARVSDLPCKLTI